MTLLQHTEVAPTAVHVILVASNMTAENHHTNLTNSRNFEDGNDDSCGGSEPTFSMGSGTPAKESEYHHLLHW
jgi:hypothetical protein